MTKPLLLMPVEQVKPAVDRGNTDPVMGAEVHNRLAAVEILSNGIEDKGEGIDAVRDDRVRKDSMGFPAGFALEPGDLYHTGFLTVCPRFNKVTGIIAVDGEGTLCTAIRASFPPRANLFHTAVKLGNSRKFLTNQLAIQEILSYHIRRMARWRIQVVFLAHVLFGGWRKNELWKGLFFLRIFMRSENTIALYLSYVK